MRGAVKLAAGALHPGLFQSACVAPVGAHNSKEMQKVPGEVLKRIDSKQTSLPRRAGRKGTTIK